MPANRKGDRHLKKNIKNILLYIGIPIVFILSILAVSHITKKNDDLKYSEIVSMVKNNEISELCKLHKILYAQFEKLAR